MASLFECEVRFTIEDIDAFRPRLAELHATLGYQYEFQDHYFRPVNDTWNPVEKNLRIREWTFPTHPTTIYFVKNEILTIDELQFKRAVYHHGKVPLLSDEPDICADLLKDLGFEPWFVLKKQHASFWEVSKYGFNTVTEYIDGIGWSGELEFEGDDPNEARVQFERALNLLRIPLEQVSFKPISAIFAEHHKLM